VFLASCGYWGGNPELVMKAPANMVLKAIDVAISQKKEKMDFIVGILEGINRGLR